MHKPMPSGDFRPDSTTQGDGGLNMGNPKLIKICPNPKCHMAVAGNIMYCIACRTPIPDPPQKAEDREEK